MFSRAPQRLLHFYATHFYAHYAARISTETFQFVIITNRLTDEDEVHLRHVRSARHRHTGDSINESTRVVSSVRKWPWSYYRWVREHLTDGSEASQSPNCFQTLYLECSVMTSVLRLVLAVRYDVIDLQSIPRAPSGAARRHVSVSTDIGRRCVLRCFHDRAIFSNEGRSMAPRVAAGVATC